MELPPQETAAESRGRGKAIGQRTAGSKGRRLVDDQPADGKFQAGSNEYWLHCWNGRQRNARRLPG